MNRKLFHAALAEAKANLEEAQDMLDPENEADVSEHVAITEVIETLVTLLYDAPSCTET